MKPRSRPPQKKIRIFYVPRFFSGQNRKKKVRKFREQMRYFQNSSLSVRHSVYGYNIQAVPNYIDLCYEIISTV